MTTAQRRAIAVALLAVAAIAAAAAVTATTWTALVLGMVPAGVAFTLAVAILTTTPHRKDATPMKHAGRALLALAALAALAAIWAPVGAWWQWAITALLALLVAASILGQKDDPR